MQYQKINNSKMVSENNLWKINVFKPLFEDSKKLNLEKLFYYISIYIFKNRKINLNTNKCDTRNTNLTSVRNKIKESNSGILCICCLICIIFPLGYKND